MNAKVDGRAAPRPLPAYVPKPDPSAANSVKLPRSSTAAAVAAAPRALTVAGWKLDDSLQRYFPPDNSGDFQPGPELTDEIEALYLYAANNNVPGLRNPMRRAFIAWADNYLANTPDGPLKGLADRIKTKQEDWVRSDDKKSVTVEAARQNMRAQDAKFAFQSWFLKADGNIAVVQNGRATPPPRRTDATAGPSFRVGDHPDSSPPNSTPPSAAGAAPAGTSAPAAGPRTPAPGASGASWSMGAALAKYFPQGFQPGEADGSAQAEETQALFLYASKQNNPLAWAMRRELSAWATDYLAKTPNGPFKDLAAQIGRTKWYQGVGARTVSEVSNELLKAGPENKADWDFHLPQMNVRFDGTFDYKTANKQITGPSATPAPDPSPRPVYRLSDYQHLDIAPDGSNAHATDPDFAPRPRGGDAPEGATDVECNTNGHRDPPHHFDLRQFADSDEAFRQYYQDRPDLFTVPPATAPAPTADAPAPALAAPGSAQPASAPTKIPPAAHDASATEKADLIALYSAMRLKLGEFGFASTKSPEQLKNATASEIGNELQGIYRKLAEQKGRIDPSIPSAFTTSKGWAEAFDRLVLDGSASSALTQARLQRLDEQNKQAFTDFYGKVIDKVQELQTKLVPPLKIDPPLRTDINLAYPQGLGDLKDELKRAFAAFAQRYHDLGVDPPPFGVVPDRDASLDVWNKALEVVGDADAFKALQAKKDGATPREWTPGAHAPGGTAIVRTIDGRRTLTRVMITTDNAEMDAPMIKAQDQLDDAEVNLARCEDLVVRFRSNPSLIRDALVGELPSLPLDEIRHHLSEMRLALDRGDLKTFHDEAQKVLPLFQKFSDEMVVFAGRVEERRSDIEAAEQIVNMTILAASMAAAPFTGGSSMAAALIIAAPAVATAGFEIIKADVTGEPVDGSAIALSAVQGIIAAKVGKLLDPLLEAAMQNPAVQQEVALFGKEAVKHALNNLLVGRINASVAAAARMAGTRGKLTGEQIRTILKEELFDHPESVILDVATGVGGATFGAHVAALKSGGRPTASATRETAAGPRRPSGAAAGTSTPVAPARGASTGAPAGGEPLPSTSGVRPRPAAPPAAAASGEPPPSRSGVRVRPGAPPAAASEARAAVGAPTGPDHAVGVALDEGPKPGDGRPRAVGGPPGGGRVPGAPGGEAGGRPRGVPRPGANNADAAGAPRDVTQPRAAAGPTGAGDTAAPHGLPLTSQQQRMYGRIVGTFDAMRNDISARIKRLEGTPQRWSTAGELLNQYKAEIETLKSRAMEATGDLREALLKAAAKVQQDSEAFMQRPEFVLLGVERGGLQSPAAAAPSAPPAAPARRVAAIPPRVHANAIIFDCNGARDAVHEIVGEKTGDWETRAKAQRDEVSAKISEARSKAAQAALAGDTESAGLYARAATEGERAFGNIEAALRAEGVESTNVDHVQDIPDADVHGADDGHAPGVGDHDIEVVPDEDVHEAPDDDALLVDDDQILDILSNEPQSAGEASPAATMPHEAASSPTPHASSDPVGIAEARTQAARDTRRALGVQLDQARKAASGYKRQFDDANAVRRFGSGDPAVARKNFQAAKNNYYLAEKNVSGLEADYDLATRRLRYFERESAKAIHKQYPDLNAEQIHQVLVDQMASADIASAQQELNARFGKTVDDATQRVIKADDALRAAKAERPVAEDKLRAAVEERQKAIDELAAKIRERNDSPAGRALRKAQDLRAKVAEARTTALAPGPNPMSGPDRPIGVPPSRPVKVIGNDPALRRLAENVRVPQEWADKGYQVVVVHGSPQGIAELTREQFVKYIQANIDPNTPIVFLSCSLDGDLAVPLRPTDHGQIPWAVSALGRGYQVVGWTKTLTVLPQAHGPYPKGMIVALDPSAARPDIMNAQPTSVPNGKMIYRLGTNCWCVCDAGAMPTLREETRTIPGDPGQGGQLLEIDGKKYRLKMYDIADPDKARRTHLPTVQYDVHQQNVAHERARSYESAAAKARGGARPGGANSAKVYEAARDFYVAKEKWYRAKQEGKPLAALSKDANDRLAVMTQRLEDFSKVVMDSAAKDPGNYRALAGELARLTRINAECASWQQNPTPQHEAVVPTPRPSTNSGLATVGGAPPPEEPYYDDWAGVRPEDSDEGEWDLLKGVQDLVDKVEHRAAITSQDIREAGVPPVIDTDPTSGKPTGYHHQSALFKIDATCTEGKFVITEIKIEPPLNKNPRVFGYLIKEALDNLRPPRFEATFTDTDPNWKSIYELIKRNESNLDRINRRMPQYEAGYTQYRIVEKTDRSYRVEFINPDLANQAGQETPNNSDAPGASGGLVPPPPPGQSGAIEAGAAPGPRTEILRANIDIMKSGRGGATGSPRFWDVANDESTHEGVKVRGLIDPKTGQIVSIGVHAVRNADQRARLRSGELNEFIIGYDFGPGMTLKASPYSLVPPDAAHPLSATAQEELKAVIAWANSPDRPLGI